MSSQYNIPNFTQVPNTLLEKLISYRIPGEARQVLDFIVRETFSFHRASVDTTLKYISDKTGLARQNVSRAVKKLVDMKVIKGIKNDSSKGYKFCVNNSLSEWKEGVKNDSKQKRGIKSDSIKNQK